MHVTDRPKYYLKSDLGRPVGQKTALHAIEGALLRKCHKHKNMSPQVHGLLFERGPHLILNEPRSI